MIYIGTVTINLQKYTQETIESINIPGEDVRLKIIDNGSIDGTQDWVANSGYEYILNGENAGVSKAWNQLIAWALAGGDMEAVFILNNDLHMHPDAFKHMIETVREGHPAVTGVDVGHQLDMLEHTTLPEPRYNPAMNFSCFGLTPECIMKVGLFDEGFKMAYFEDNDYHHRMQLEDIIGVCDMWAPFVHYASRTIKEGGVNHHKAFDANKEYFYQKWGYLP